MIKPSPQLIELLQNIKNKREELGLTSRKIEEELIIGPGWLDRIESGEISISLEMLFSLLKHTGISLGDVSMNLQEENSQDIPRNIVVEQSGNDIDIHFKYSKFDAHYKLENATVSKFNEVIKCIRDNLAQLPSAQTNNSEAIKTNSVAESFKKAVSFWPHANPSDIWWFIIYRAYVDPLNHPARFSRLSFEQSWKRTGGWALEEVLVRHYSPHLTSKGINLYIPPTEKRQELLAQAKTDHRLEADKADIFLTGTHNDEELFFGVIHVKASFAERRTDDVPMSKALVDAGYFSPLWTMDCKSSPSKKPNNKGELGKPWPSQRSAKRVDIEDNGYFSSCYSYNTNTYPTPANQTSTAQIYCGNFNNAESDIFHQHICDHWEKFKELQTNL